MSDKVKLHMYDLSGGFANSLSWLLVGKQIEGLWYTSIVVFGKEFYFGQKGVEVHTPNTNFFGKPADKVRILGSTCQTRTRFYDYLEELKMGEFAPGEYSFLSFNCNTFSDKLSRFLIGQGIPKEILDLPDDIMTGGRERASQVAAICTVHVVKKLFSGPNKKTEEKAKAGPSWLEFIDTTAIMATIGTAFLNRMKEGRNDNCSQGWRSNHHDSNFD